MAKQHADVIRRMSCGEEETLPLLQHVQRPSYAGPGAAAEAGLHASSAAGCCSSSGISGTEIMACGSSGGKKGDLEDGGPLRTCRICFDSEDPSASSELDNPMISPCLCSGSSRYVHRKCLQQWRTSNHRADVYYQCEVCKFRYVYRRLWWATLLGHRITVLLSFVLMVGVMTWLLGYIPLTPSAAADKAGRLLTHALNGVVLMGILGMALTLAMLALRACGFTGAWCRCLPDSLLHSCCLCCSECSGPSLLWGDITMVGAECGLAFLSLLIIMTVSVGFLMSCYMLYGVLWAVNMHLLERAQLMVENVAPAGTDHPHDHAPGAPGSSCCHQAGGGGGGGGGGHHHHLHYGSGGGGGGGGAAAGEPCAPLGARDSYSAAGGAVGDQHC